MSALQHSRHTMHVTRAMAVVFDPEIESGQVLLSERKNVWL